MIEGGKPVLPVPVHKVTKHRVSQIDIDNLGGREVAGPFFDAGGICAAIAALPEKRGDLHVPSWHRFDLVLQGRMKVRFGRDTVIAEKGDLVCMPAGFLTSRTGLGPIEVIYIVLADDPIWSPLKAIGQSIRKYESSDMVYILVSKLIGALRSPDIYSIRCARENSETLVSLLKREMHQSSNEWNSDRTKRLAELLDSIRAKPDFKWDSPTMAQKVNMSERNLSRVFQRVFNMPPAQMVITIRMELAARMLIKTNMTLSAIANSVGYDSPFSFSRLFRKHVGTSPQHYRELPAGQRQSSLSIEK